MSNNAEKHATPFTEVNIMDWVFRDPVQKKQPGKKTGPKVGYINENGSTLNSPFVQMALFSTDEGNPSADPTVTRLPFGVSEPFNPEQSEGRRSVRCTLPQRAQQEFVASIDELAVRVALEKMFVWFPDMATDIEKEIAEFIADYKEDNGGDVPSDEAIEQERSRIKSMFQRTVKKSYKPLLIPNIDKKSGEPVCNKDGVPYPPHLNTKCNINGDYEIEVFSYVNKQWFNKRWQDIPKGVRAVPCVEFSGFWFTSAGFGISAVMRKVVIFPYGGRTDAVPRGPGGFALPNNFQAPMLVEGAEEPTFTDVPDIDPKAEEAMDDAAHGNDVMDE